MKKLSLCIKNYALCIIMSLYMVSCEGDNGGDDNNGGSGEEQPQEIAGFRYVDLGLPSGLKWAVHNMGALEQQALTVILSSSLDSAI